MNGGLLHLHSSTALPLDPAPTPPPRCSVLLQHSGPKRPRRALETWPGGRSKIPPCHKPLRDGEPLTLLYSDRAAEFPYSLSSLKGVILTSSVSFRVLSGLLNLMVEVNITAKARLVQLDSGAHRLLVENCKTNLGGVQILSG